MTFYEAMLSEENSKAVDRLTVALRSDELPEGVRNDARTIAGVLTTVDNTLDEFRSEAALVPDFFQNNFYGVEGARQMQTEANLKCIRDNDPTALINRLEGRVRTFLSSLDDRARPVPPTDDPALLQSLLLGARQDAGLALANTRNNFAEAILNLQTEALKGGEDALAYLLGATEWPVRFVKANGSVEEQLDLERIRGTLRDNVSDPSATPYRRAAERLSDLEGVPEGYRVTWRFALEESGLLTEEVKTALGL